MDPPKKNPKKTYDVLKFDDGRTFDTWQEALKALVAEKGITGDLKNIADRLPWDSEEY
jgi:hypothetical protein